MTDYVHKSLGPTLVAQPGSGDGSPPTADPLPTYDTPRVTCGSVSLCEVCDVWLEHEYVAVVDGKQTCIACMEVTR
jgi:hypothetical protein